MSTTTAGTMSPTHIMNTYQVGSHDWSWADEAADLVSRTRFAEIVAELHAAGWCHPIVVSEGRVVDGHHRVLAAHLLGWTVVAVDRREGSQ